jgi:hypothetical protein
MSHESVRSRVKPATLGLAFVPGWTSRPGRPWSQPLRNRQAASPGAAETDRLRLADAAAPDNAPSAAGEPNAVSIRVHPWLAPLA